MLFPFAVSKYETYHPRWLGGADSVLLIAVENTQVGEWAAYAGALGHPGNDGDVGDAHRIADYGGKLSEAEARPFFPELAKVPYRR